ncbi:MAG: twin-arginine translocase subunit TatC [Chloroflexota bacterium]|jgi:sec-independent protein translocase protein TatC
MMSEQVDLGDGQTILQHLDELRVRLTWAIAVLAIAVVISFLFTERLLNILIEPYGEQLQTLSPTEGIETYFRVALIAGAAIAMPWILYQLWLFIAPGLHANEKRYVYVFIPSATLLFLLGVAFTWFILLPSAILFLSTFLPSVFSPEWTSQEYIGFATSFLFWIGLSFEIPLIVFFFARFGLVTSQALRDQWRIAVVAIAILAAVITPSIDPVTMLLTMAPLLILYVLSIALAAVGQRQFQRTVTLDEEPEAQ